DQQVLLPNFQCQGSGKSSGNRIQKSLGNRISKSSGNRIPESSGNRIPESLGNRIPESSGKRIPRSSGNRILEPAPLCSAEVWAFHCTMDQLGHVRSAAPAQGAKEGLSKAAASQKNAYTRLVQKHHSGRFQSYLNHIAQKMQLEEGFSNDPSLDLDLPLRRG
ncbi:hypothetical protein DV515_00008672, partial [Chloebia gouldiae]